MKFFPHVHVSNCFGTITLNLAVKLVFSVVAACPLSMSDSGSLISFQPSYITETESQNPKNWSPPLQFSQFSSLQAWTSQPHSNIAKSCMHVLSWAVGHQRNSFRSLTKITFFLMVHFIQFVRCTKGEAALQRTQSKPVSEWGIDEVGHWE